MELPIRAGRDPIRTGSHGRDMGRSLHYPSDMSDTPSRAYSAAALARVDPPLRTHLPFTSARKFGGLTGTTQGIKTTIDRHGRPAVQAAGG